VLYEKQPMARKPTTFEDSPIDPYDQFMRNAWMLAIVGALILAGFVYFLSRQTPPPLGAPPSHQSARLTR
jgi:hypothetical protein